MPQRKYNFDFMQEDSGHPPESVLITLAMLCAGLDLVRDLETTEKATPDNLEDFSDQDYDNLFFISAVGTSGDNLMFTQSVYAMMTLPRPDGEIFNRVMTRQEEECDNPECEVHAHSARAGEKDHGAERKVETLSADEAAREMLAGIEAKSMPQA